MRLAKYLAHSGVASRREAERLIAAGRVTVGGEVVTDPARDVGADSGVAVDGEAVAPEPREVWLLNKPLDVVSTAREPGRRRAVVDLVDTERRLYPVGRLDADSTGLILLTNDGELANRLTHPRYEVPKTYVAELRRPADERQLRRLRQGVALEDGPTSPAAVRRTGPREVEITIHEGRNRQIRRMVEKVGNEVVALRRTGFGSLGLDELGEGESRRLGRSELRRLWKDAGHDALRARAPRMTQISERVFAVRGAAQAERNDRESILATAAELIRELIARNELEPEAMVSCILTCTDDLDAEFPAVAARDVGLAAVPLLCTREMVVPGAMERVIRALVHYYAPPGHEPVHTYLGAARELRSDLHSAQ